MQKIEAHFFGSAAKPFLLLNIPRPHPPIPPKTNIFLSNPAVPSRRSSLRISYTSKAKRNTSAS